MKYILKRARLTAFSFGINRIGQTKKENKDVERLNLAVDKGRELQHLNPKDGDVDEAEAEVDEPELEPEELELEVARNADEVIKGRGKRGRNRKSAALEADAPDRSVRAIEGTSSADV